MYTPLLPFTGPANAPLAVFAATAPTIGSDAPVEAMYVGDANDTCLMVSTTTSFSFCASAMLFTLFNHVAYPAFMGSEFFFRLMPFTAFLMAAFSALRLAKFNIDERQHTGFIGMPTPANAIFWGALLTSSEAWLTSPRFNALFLFLFMLLFCWLLVCEVPMFAFKSLSWQNDKIKFLYLGLSLLILAGGAVVGSTHPELGVWMGLFRGVACCIGLYVLMSIVASVLPQDRS